MTKPKDFDHFPLTQLAKAHLKETRKALDAFNKSVLQLAHTASGR